MQLALIYLNLSYDKHALNYLYLTLYLCLSHRQQTDNLDSCCTHCLCCVNKNAATSLSHKLFHFSHCRSCFAGLCMRNISFMQRCTSQNWVLHFLRESRRFMQGEPKTRLLKSVAPVYDVTESHSVMFSSLRGASVVF